MIHNGSTGLLLPLHANGKDIAEAILSIGPKDFERMRFAARALYEEQLNWDAWAARASQLISEKIFRNSGEAHVIS
jgi:hypothetical protein